MTLFDCDEPAPKYSEKPKPTHIAKWEASSTARKCQECQASQHEGAAILARRATWKRTDCDGIDYYCYLHAIPYRDADDALAKEVEAHAHFKRAKS